MAGLKPAAELAVKDAYSALKALLVRRYNSVDMTPIENKPESQVKRDSVAEDLTDSGADHDAELLQCAQALLQLIQSHAPGAGAAIGIDLEKITGAALRIRDVNAEGTGVRVRDSNFSGDIEITGVQAGNHRNP